MTKKKYILTRVSSFVKMFTLYISTEKDLNMFYAYNVASPMETNLEDLIHEKLNATVCDIICYAKHCDTREQYLLEMQDPHSVHAFRGFIARERDVRIWKHTTFNVHVEQWDRNSELLILISPVFALATAFFESLFFALLCAALLPFVIVWTRTTAQDDIDNLFASLVKFVTISPEKRRRIAAWIAPK
jgi:hypothetical protein